MQSVAFDVARVRGLYPTVGAGIAHLDGTYSTLQPESVIRAIITALRSSPTQPGSRSTRSQRSSAAVDRARRAMADLVGGHPSDVVLGGNLSVLLQRFALLLSRDWQLGDEIVLSRACHDANLRPWLAAARASGVIVRWAEVDVETGDLPSWQYDGLINAHTRIVALPLANGATGSIPDVMAIARAAHSVGALVVVDAGVAVPYLPIDLIEIGADLLGLSAPAFGGPTVGALVARPGLLQEMDPDAPGAIPERYELGSLPVELVDGLVAAVDHLAALDERATGNRRERLTTSLIASGSYLAWLFESLESRLRALPMVTVLGGSQRPLPAAAFTVVGRRPHDVGDFLARRGVSIWTGPGGLTELMSSLGADELGGAAYLGLMPHNTMSEVDRFIEAMQALVGGY